MRKTISTLVVVAISCVSAPAAAGFYNGNELKRLCDSGSSYCSGYIMGVVDDLLWRQDLVGAKKEYCIPDGTESGQIVDLVKKHLEASPEQRHWPAGILITNAMAKAYWCNKKA